MTTPVPTIDADFMALCPALTDEEIRLLRDSIMAEGCREAIVCWDTAGTPIVDGHHRYEICHHEGIDFDVKLKDFPDRAAAKRWILLNQLARRNLTETQRAMLRGRLYGEAKSERGGDHTPQTGRAKGQNDTLLAQGGDTAGLVASRDGVSSSTVKRDNAFAKAADAVIEKAPELKQPIEQGAITKTAVKALAKAPKAELKKLGKLQGSGLRKAASEVAKKLKPPKAAKPKSGQQKRDPRIWGEIEGYLGKAMNRSDELHRQFPNQPLHTVLLKEIKQCFHTLKQWKEEPKSHRGAPLCGTTLRRAARCSATQRFAVPRPASLRSLSLRSSSPRAPTQRFRGGYSCVSRPSK